MKLFVCVCLVLVILEEYHCKPCFFRLFGRGRNDNDEEKKLSFNLGFTAKTMISGQSEHSHENGNRPSYHPHHHRYPPYGPNGLRHRPSYQPYYSPSIYPSYRTPYSTWSRRPFDATYNIPYGRQGGASIGTRQRTPYHRGSYRPHYERPRFGTLYPTPFDMAHKTPNGTPNGSPYGAPNGLSNSTPNGTPAETPVETGDGSSQRKHFFVTPTGIQETPAQPLDDAS